MGLNIGKQVVTSLKLSRQESKVPTPSPRVAGYKKRTGQSLKKRQGWMEEFEESTEMDVDVNG